MYNSLKYELLIGGTKIKQVQFIYLGSVLSKTGKSDKFKVILDWRTLD